MGQALRPNAWEKEVPREPSESNMRLKLTTCFFRLEDLSGIGSSFRCLIYPFVTIRFKSVNIQGHFTLFINLNPDNYFKKRFYK